MADFQVCRAVELLEFAAARLVRHGENPNVDFVLAMQDCARELLGREERSRTIWPVTAWPEGKCRAEFSAEETRAVTAAQIAYVSGKPRGPARYRFLRMLKEEGPLPSYKDYDYFTHFEAKREAMSLRDEVYLNDWAQANG